MYKLTQFDNVIIKLEDSSFVPKDVNNAQYQQYLAWLEAGNTPEPADVIPEPPKVVTPRQARVALALSESPNPNFANLLEFVEAALNELPEPDRTVAKLTWEYATEIIEDDPLIQTMAQVIPLTDAQVSDLFTFAATL